MSATASAIRTAQRVDRFTYAIRNIVAEAKKVEAAGKKVRYLNIGDPNQFGFLTPPHLIEAVVKAMRDGHNGYAPSPGIAEAREAAAADFVSRGVNVSADRVLITSGTSEGIELALTGIVDEGEEVLVPSPTYPLYTAVLAKIGAQPAYYRTDHTNNWQPDLDHLRSLINAKTRALVVIDPNNPTGAIYPDATRRALIEIAETHGLVILADEVYGDLVLRRRGAADGGARQRRADHFLLEPVEGVSRARLARGMDGGGIVAAARSARSPRSRSWPTAACAARARCSTRSPRRSPATDRTRWRSARQLRERAELTTERMNAIPGISCVTPKSAFYAMPKVELPPGKTDTDFVLGLLRAKGVLTRLRLGIRHRARRRLLPHRLPRLTR